MTPILLSWSGGKDSALALWELQQSGEFEVAGLLTSVTAGYDRVSMHGVRNELLDKQVAAIGLPVEKIVLPQPCANEDYERLMKEAMLCYREQGIDTVAFGDLFLADVRKYREDNLAQVGMKALFPLWGRDTAALAREFVDAGFRAVVTCVDTEQIDKSFAGRIIDHQFLADLPATADPCAENGEFHTFVFAGPIFREEIPFTKGECVLRDERFYFCDL
ncbi:MAG: diphthine--ammonia ligase, partial [Alphaproteobacteria bacterium]